MKAWMLVLVAAVGMAGCQGKPATDKVVASVNNYEISQGEFEERFQEHNRGKSDTLEGRKEYLNNLIQQKLILQNAEARGLDRGANFLKLIERFWEASLTRLAIGTTLKANPDAWSVTDKEIEEAYLKGSPAGTVGKSSPGVYRQIKADLTKMKQDAWIRGWIAGLSRNATIQMHEEFLKKGK